MSLPRSAEGAEVPIERILYGSVAAANAALVAVGGIVQSRLQTTLTVPGVGEIVRCFAVLSNGLTDDEATEERTDVNVPIGLLHFDSKDLALLNQVHTGVSQRADRMLEVPDNDRVRRKIDEGRLKYLPVNKVLALRIEQNLARVGMHMPWSIGGLDVAFGSRCKTHLAGFGFVCYFAHLGRIAPVDGKAAFVRSRHVSFPFGVDGVHTWDPAISEDIIDEDCGMLIEANAIS